MTEVLTGIWVAPEGAVHLHFREPENGQTTLKNEGFEGFGWISAADLKAGSVEGGSVVELRGSGQLDRLLSTTCFKTYQHWVSREGYSQKLESVRPYESQHMMRLGYRLFEGLRFDQLKRCQVDIETDCSAPGKFSNPYENAVLAIGMKMGEREQLLCLESEDREGEKKLLEAFVQTLQDWDPDVIEGHNIFSFDLNYLKIRSARRKVAVQWGRFGQLATFRKSRLKVAERWVDFQRCDIPGRTVFDTYLMAQLYDITARDMPSYGLKAVARYFGVTDQLDHERTYIDGSLIHRLFREDREQFLEYLRDDLLETEGIAAILLPTYFEQSKAFPALLQEACLRGTAGKVDMLFLEKYYHAKHALPLPADGFAEFAGGYTKSFQQGVFRNVVHYDVASLYPSLMLRLERNPRPDDLGVFLSMLRELRKYRLEYKEKARSEEDAGLRREYQARQTSFKILINSFYGYLGFPGARFGDGELAALITAEGRELLQSIIAAMESLDVQPLEADTDGIYVSSEEASRDPLALLEKVQSTLPDGIDLEWGGSYESMLCYKAKNYALFDGSKVLIRGSALRSRGMEPYLSELTRQLIHALLGALDGDPRKSLAEYREKIKNGRMEVDRLAKTETLNQNPSKYLKAVEESGKPRRAALEVALAMDPVPGMGDRVRYYLGAKSKGRTAMWQRAYAVKDFHPLERPYDAASYLKKLDEWETKYVELLELLQAN